MSFITNLFAGGASQLVDSVGNVLDKVVTTKGDKMQLENELKKADNDYQISMKTLDLQGQQAVLADVDSARKRDAAVEESANASKLSKNTPPYLAIGTTVLTFALFYYLMFYPGEIQQSKREVILYILGVLSAILTQVFSFYFGSSQGSQAKNATIERMHNQTAAQASK
jgi:hypothetical protein